MKDNFSIQADKYAKFRPVYPSVLFDHLIKVVQRKGNAWDSGAGNGQIASGLARSFDAVFATDISKNQIARGHRAENIFYSVQAAEQTDFEDNFFDLIVVGQAIHWFNFEKFYAEVRRTARHGAIFCAVGYSRFQIAEPIDALVADFYNLVLGDYWDEERKYLKEEYNSIPFPFTPLEVPQMCIDEFWSLDHLIGYLASLSAVRHYIKCHGCDPTHDLRPALQTLWGASRNRRVQFPLYTRLGRVT